MSRLYSSPLRVYLLLAVLALAGILAGLRLPVSLFPNSSRPTVQVYIHYGDSTAEEFLRNYGESLESKLHVISTEQVEVEKLTADYRSSSVEYRILFKWGAPPRAALREVQNVVNGFSGRLPKEMRDSVDVEMWNRNSGFLAVSYYSPTRSLDAVFDIVEPLLVPKLSKVSDAESPGLWNPNKKEIRVELKPETMASLGLFPRDIDRAVESAISAYSGGSVTIGTSQLNVQMPRAVSAGSVVDDLKRALVSSEGGSNLVHLGDVARIDLGPATGDAKTFKTSGAPSLILFAQPRPGGNVKRMSEDILEIVREVQPSLPKDIQYKILVDPSEFIRASVENVFREVLIGAGLAVLVLFLFIGSMRNVATAAIEIPLSMVLAFILMKLSGMNMNLISLGGLALAAGMNVDASVVVMENIFRHFETAPPGIDYAGRLRLVTKAVSEVSFAVIASTISSLVVFVPLAFTSDLSYAILGDLAKTVVFSHGFSAIVALVLVPTVRLHLMSRGADMHAHSPVERYIAAIENAYARALGWFIASPRAKKGAYLGLAATLALLTALVLPRLPREVIGRPDTDWMILGIETKGNTLLRQMESQAEQDEAVLLGKLGGKVQYTFNQIVGPNNAYLMARLKDKRDMREAWTALETNFKNTPLVSYWVAPWNPAELPIPDPPKVRIDVRGGELTDRARVAQQLGDLLQENKIFPRVSTTPEAERRESISLRPNTEQWSALWKGGARFLPSDLADLARVATDGRRTGRISVGTRLTDIMLTYPEGTVSTAEDLGSLPVGAGAKIVPLKALAPVTVSESRPPLYREDERELFTVSGREDEQSKANGEKDKKRAEELIGNWRSRAGSVPTGVSVSFEDAEKDLHDALQQLGTAVGLSILLIFITLVLQFGDVVSSALVLVAVPLGLIGVLLSLFVFKSSLSLNSALGVILLNGIAVANSIILVDFLKRLVESGLEPRAAAVMAARKRLRPILITSLTTVLGMLPIALGLGEGGRILQPLGIAVSGGLWLSMGLTLFIVPALQVSYLELRARRRVVDDVSALNQDSVGPRINLNPQPSGLARLKGLIVGKKGAAGAFAGGASTGHTVDSMTCTVFALAALLSGAHAHAATAPLSFDSALDTIVRRSTALGIQHTNVEATEARSLPIRTTFVPAVSAVGTEAKYKYGGATDPGYISSGTRSAQLQGALNVFRFGADLSNWSAAASDEAAQSALLESTVLRSEDSGVQLLVGRIQRALELDVLRKRAESRRRLVEIARERFERGLLPLQEKQKLEIDLANDEARLEDGTILDDAAKASLASALGEGDVALEWPWKPRLEAAGSRRNAPLDLEQLPAWRAARAQANAEEERSTRALRLMLPSIDATGSYGYTNSYNNNGPMQLGWTGAVSLTVPLFDHLSNYSSYRAQVATRRSAEFTLEQAERDARSELASASSAFAHEFGSAKIRSRTAVTARHLYADNLKRFQSGRANADELAVDEQRLFDAEQLDVDGWAAAHVSYARLCHALGRKLADCSKN